MHKLFKTLTIFSFAVGLFLYASGNSAYFSHSGGTGLVMLVICTPIFAILTNISKRTEGNQTTSIRARRLRKLFWFGLIMVVAGFALYFSSFIGDQGFGALVPAALGALSLLIGIAALTISALKR